VIPGLRARSRHSNRSTDGTVAVIGNYGNTNLGDDATLATIIEHVGRRRPKAKTIALAVDPEAAHAQHGITALPSGRYTKSRASRSAATTERRGSPMSTLLRRLFRPVASVARGPLDLLVWLRALAGEVVFPIKCWAAMDGVDLLIIGGGGQLTDQFFGPWNFPYLLLIWVLVAKVSGARVGFVCVGAGTIASRLSRIFLKTALSLADHRSFRDQRSRRIVEELGVPAPNLVVADLVFSLEGAPRVVARRPSGPPRAVGFNVFPYHAPFYWPDADPTIYRAYLESSARLIEWLGRQGYVVHLFPTQLRADPRVIRDLIATMEAHGIRLPAGQLIHAPVTGMESLTATIAAMDIVIVTRYHAMVMALRAGIPVFALSSQPKTDDLMADMGLSAYRVSIDNIQMDALTARFTSLAQNAQSVRDQIQARGRELRREIDELMDGLLGVPRSAADTGPIPSSVTSPGAATHVLRRPSA
jgi:polysaccharide pyruvyl transferase WcaK-like protein